MFFSLFDCVLLVTLHVTCIIDYALPCCGKGGEPKPLLKNIRRRTETSSKFKIGIQLPQNYVPPKLFLRPLHTKQILLSKRQLGPVK